MPVMSAIEGAFCRSAPWQLLARRAVLPWALGGRELAGDVLLSSTGCGSPRVAHLMRSSARSPR